MRRHALVRWGGGAAVAGGTLRGVTALLPSAHTIFIHLTYLAVDLLLLLAVLGRYVFQRERSAGWGAFGALPAAAASGLLILDDLFSPTFALYPIAAVVFGLGLGVFALGVWRAQTLPRWIAGVWLATIIVGALGPGVPTLQVLFVAAGLLFAAGFIGAGFYLIAAPDSVLYSAPHEFPRLHREKYWS